MKKILLISSLIMLSATAIYAQSKVPLTFNYQGAVRNADGTPLGSRMITLRLSILKETVNGAVEYYEVRRLKTNALGLYQVQIGAAGAEASSASEGKPFNQIAWGAGEKYFRVEIDLFAGDKFVFAGTSLITSTPYAIYAENGGSSGYNTWVLKPGNVGKTQDDYLEFLKNSAKMEVAANAKDLTVDSAIDGILTVTNGKGAVLTATLIKLDKVIFDKAAKQAIVDGLNVSTRDSANIALNNALNNQSTKALSDSTAQIGSSEHALQEAVKALASVTTMGNGNLSANDNGIDPMQILRVEGGANATFQDASYIISKSALNKNTTDALKAKDGANGANELKEAVNYQVADGINQALATPPTGTEADLMLLKAIKEAAGKSPMGNGTLMAGDTVNLAATALTPVLTLSDTNNKATFQDIKLNFDKEALKQSLATGISNATNEPISTGSAADDALVTALVQLSNVKAGNGKVTTHSDGNSSTEILTIGPAATEQNATTFKNLDLKISRLALNHNTTDALVNPTAENGGGPLQDAINNLTANSLNRDSTLATNSELLLQVAVKNKIIEIASDPKIGESVSAASSRISLAGSPSAAVLKPFSIDVHEPSLNLMRIGGVLPIIKLTPGANDQVLSTVRGVPTWTTPRIVDGSETKLIAGTNIEVLGNGTATTPFVINNTYIDGDQSDTNEIQNLTNIAPNSLSISSGNTVSIVNTVTTRLLNNFLTTEVNGVGSLPIDLSVYANKPESDPVANSKIVNVGVRGAGLSVAGVANQTLVNEPNYILSLNPATTSTLGGIVVGNNLTIDGNGRLSSISSADGSETKVRGGLDIEVLGTGTTLDPYFVNSTYKLPIANMHTLGGVKQGAGITIAADGTISTDNNGTISSISGTAPIRVTGTAAAPIIGVAIASNSLVGVVKEAAVFPTVLVNPEGDLSVDATNVLLTGDVVGSLNANIVERIQQVEVAAVPPKLSQVMQYDGTRWRPTDLAPERIQRAANGLNVSARQVELGGDLTKQTAIITSATNTLALVGLEDQTANINTYNQVLVQQLDGKLAYLPLAKVKPVSKTKEMIVVAPNVDFKFTDGAADRKGLTIDQILVFKNGVCLSNLRVGYEFDPNTGIVNVRNDNNASVLSTGDEIRVQWVNN